MMARKAAVNCCEEVAENRAVEDVMLTRKKEMELVDVWLRSECYVSLGKDEENDWS